MRHKFTQTCPACLGEGVIHREVINSFEDDSDRSDNIKYRTYICEEHLCDRCEGNGYTKTTTPTIFLQDITDGYSKY